MQIGATSGHQIPAEIASLSLNSSVQAVYAGLAQLALADIAELRELAPADLAKLSTILRFSEPAAPQAPADPTLREAILAVEEGRFEQAIGYLASAITRDPARADELRDRPEFAPIRANLDQLLNRVTQVSKIRAESDLARIEHSLDEAGWPKLPQWETRPEILVRLARQLFEAGGYPNYVRSAELAQTVLQSAYWEAFIPQAPPLSPARQVLIDQALIDRDIEGALSPAPPLWKTLYDEVPVVLRVLWQRAPLLVLFFAWLTIGSAAGLFYALMRVFSPGASLRSLGDIGFSLWALGFLALVGFGFYARVRNRPRG
jgi:tetratricopeptide (TPR) repeat protein